MTSVDSNFNFLCGRPHGAGPPSPSTCVHQSLTPSPLRVDVINGWPLTAYSVLVWRFLYLPYLLIAALIFSCLNSLVKEIEHTSESLRSRGGRLAVAHIVSSYLFVVFRCHKHRQRKLHVRSSRTGSSYTRSRDSSRVRQRYGDFVAQLQLFQIFIATICLSLCLSLSVCLYVSVCLYFCLCLYVCMSLSVCLSFSM